MKKKNLYFLILISFIILLICHIVSFPKKEGFETYEIPKVIWIYWDTPKLPNKIDEIIRNNQKVLYDYEFIVLNKDNVKQYLDFSSFPPNYKQLIVQHQADYIRLRLLERYGGIWMDASIVVQSKPAFDQLYNETIQSQAELLSFTNYEKVPQMKYHQHIGNWFLIAPLHSRIVKEWLEEFTKAINIGFDAYYDSIKDACYIDYDITNQKNYLVQHMALQFILQNETWNPKVITKSSNKDMLKIQTDCQWDKECTQNYIIQNQKEIKKLPYFKLTRFERDLFNDDYFDTK